MIATVRETITSLKKPDYGQVIVTKTTKSVFWYWTKYFLIIAAIPIIAAVVLLTRFLPQLPGFVEKKLPEGVLGFKDKVMFSTVKQPLVYEFADGQTSFKFVFDLEASPSALDSVDTGLLILKDRIITKSNAGQSQAQEYGNVPDFSIDKFQIAAWLQSHLSGLWSVGFFLILVLSSIIIGITWVIRAGFFLVWALIFWLFSKYVLKQPLTYIQILKLVIYASVLPLILSVILAIMPNSLLSLLNTGIFVAFTYIWIKNFSAVPSPEKPTTK